jgi:hypothetical protein
MTTTATVMAMGSNALRSQSDSRGAGTAAYAAADPGRWLCLVSGLAATGC